MSVCNESKDLFGEYAARIAKGGVRPSKNVRLEIYQYDPARTFGSVGLLAILHAQILSLVHNNVFVTLRNTFGEDRSVVHEIRTGTSI